jgi:hypothetical protein
MFPDCPPATNTKPWLSTTTPHGVCKSEVSWNLQICFPFISQQVTNPVYNLYTNTSNITLYYSAGNFIGMVQLLNPLEGLFYDITSIDTNTIAVSTGKCIGIVNIDTQNVLHTIKNDRVCYGITHCDGKLYYCSNSFNSWTIPMKLPAL